MPAYPKAETNFGKPRAPRCDFQRCHYPAIPELLPTRICYEHMRKRLDAWFSQLIRQRDGRCRLRLYAPDTRCSPGLQCCHIFSRRFDWTAYDPENAVAGCPAHHKLFTENPDRWSEARAQLLGPYKLRVLGDRAMHSQGHFDFITLYRTVFALDAEPG